MSEVFVFGSNLAGRHGKGAAKHALQYYGAIYGHGYGRQGNSYAIPTKDYYLRTLDLKLIQEFINNFIGYAEEHPEDIFLLTPVGCGLAGYERSQIKPLFNEVPKNVIFLKEWDEV